MSEHDVKEFVEFNDKTQNLDFTIFLKYLTQKSRVSLKRFLLFDDYILNNFANQFNNRS